MDIKLNLDKKSTIKADFAALTADLAKMEPLLSIFPKLEKLTKLGENSFETQLKPIGAMGVEHAVTYAAEYTLTEGGTVLAFKGLDGKGNATLSGDFEFRDKGGEIEVEIKIGGQLRDIKVPMMMRPAAGGFIKTMFEGLVDRFIEKIGEKYGK